MDSCYEVLLYCVPNVLSLGVEYEWHTPDHDVTILPSTPIVYVSVPGIYFCTVTYNDQEVISEPSDVKISPGMFL